MSYTFEKLTATTDIAKHILDGLLGRVVGKKIATVEEESKKIVYITAIILSFEKKESQLPMGLTCSTYYYQLAEFARETNQCKLEAFFREKLIALGSGVSTRTHLN